MSGLLRKVDAVTVRVPDLDSGLEFYRDRLGHEVVWRSDTIGQAGLRLPDSDTEIVLSTELEYAPSWLVNFADEAAEEIERAGGRVIEQPFEIPVGRCAVVEDPFGNTLVLLDLSKGLYITDDQGRVTGVER
ncbi:putative enzyme related to lactoylglutathione lyase [Kribbella antiqua]|uniref:Putative enzyme related to lactoylglutathione lyase n=1 Tax=Kribbella antiqua TaxID=2512217 RepID=A0A4R2I8U2_9ACTN|nr:VOC family protein [Kribbella antiqua]TCO40557.1 putative enzyme related to lactoylglutathione lyase [Kribbella antiqua]